MLFNFIDEIDFCIYFISQFFLLYFYPISFSISRGCNSKDKPLQQPEGFTWIFWNSSVLVLRCSVQCSNTRITENRCCVQCSNIMLINIKYADKLKRQESKRHREFVDQIRWQTHLLWGLSSQEGNPSH